MTTSSRVVRRVGPAIRERLSRHGGPSLSSYLAAHTVVSRRSRLSEPASAQRQSMCLWLFDSPATAVLFRHTVVVMERRIA